MQTERNELIKVAKQDENALFLKVDEKSNDVVNQIKQLTLLTSKDIKELEEAQTFILSTYIDVPEYRPLAMKLASVLNDGHFPTTDTKYWQCKKEAEVHFYQLVSDIFKLKRSVIDVNEMNYLIASYSAAIEKNISIDGRDPILLGFELDRLMIKKEEYLFNTKKVEKTIKYRITEITDWAKISKSLESGCKHSTKNYGEHFVESFYKTLEHEIANAKDPETKRNFSSQLETLKKVIRS